MLELSMPSWQRRDLTMVLATLLFLPLLLLLAKSLMEISKGRGRKQLLRACRLDATLSTRRRALSKLAYWAMASVGVLDGEVGS